MLDQTLTRLLAPLPPASVLQLPTLTVAASLVLCLALITEQDKKRKVIDYQKRSNGAESKRLNAPFEIFRISFIPFAGRSEAVVNIP